MIASSKKRVRLTPHQKALEDLRMKLAKMEKEKFEALVKAEDLQDQANDMLRERDRFCAALNIGQLGYIPGFSVRPTTPSFTEIAVHVGRRFALADLAEKYMKLENVRNVLIEVDEHSKAIREIRTNLERSRKDS